jgi:hypothetical protein
VPRGPLVRGPYAKRGGDQARAAEAAAEAGGERDAARRAAAV